jgi:outer membrane lipoprotein-sorting protein
MNVTGRKVTGGNVTDKKVTGGNVAVRRWALPAVVAATVAAGAGITAGAATADVDLPDLSPQQVLVLAQESRVSAWSGDVRVTADLGLPELPASTGGGGHDSGPLALLTGDSELRVWVDGVARQRVQVLRQWSQTDIVHDGRELWTYDSQEDVYRHATLPDLDLPEHAREHPRMTAPTPEAFAEWALGALEPTTAVSVGEDVAVAGREAYELRLAPRSADTLVGQIALAVDAETGMALRVSVTARGEAEPSLLVGYTALDLSAPPASRFDLEPAEGATVEELTDVAWKDMAYDGWRASDPSGVPQVIGTGWDTVLSLPWEGEDERAGHHERDGQDERAGLLDAVTTPVDGGRLLETDLVSVLRTDDGRLLIGAVTPEALLEAAR